MCSLYPYICKYGKFPVGHPKIHFGEESCAQLLREKNGFQNINGLIKCRILPIQTLFHPVLPVRMHNRLFFALCRSCCELKQEGICNHVENERAFTGTWVIDEIQVAIEAGYKVLNTYEIWEYDVTQYDPITRERGLFVGYINTMLKIKQEASG